MRPNLNLFNLIKTLSKSEKRYFKMFASMQSGDKNYLKLFNEIDRMKIYDEKKIRDVFKNEIFIKQLTFTKNYLYNLILRCLYLYNSTGSVDSQLNELLFRCNYFHRNALLNEFSKSVIAGKNISLEYERFLFFLKFVSVEKIMSGESDLTDSSDITHEELVIEKISNLFVYDSYVSMINGIYRQEGRTREEVLFNYIEKIKKSPLLTSEEFALSVLAKEKYFKILQIIADIYGDLDGMYNYCKKRLDLVSNNPKIFFERTFNYWFDILFHLILYSIRNKKEKKLIEYLHLLESHSSNSVSDKINMFLIQAILSVNLIINEKKWNKIDDLMERIEIGLTLYKGKLDSDYEITLYDFITRMYVEAGNFQSALGFINILLNHKNISARRDIEYNAKLLNLIIHYEIKNYDYLEYLIITTYRYFYKRKKIYKLENLVLNFIKRLPKMNNENDLKENFEFLQNDMKSVYKEHHEKNIFLYFNYLEWINKKISELKI